MKHFKIKKNKHEQGMTLVEVLVSVALTSVLGLGVAIFVSQQNQTLKELQYSMNMRIIAKKIEGAAGRPDVIKASAEQSNLKGNRLLRDCLGWITEGDTAKRNTAKPKKCTVTDPKNQVAIELIIPYNKKKGKINRKILERNTIAGTKEKPVRYSLSGTPHCDEKYHTITGSCQIEVKAFFWATCAADVSRVSKRIETGSQLPQQDQACNVAQAINIRYQVEHKYFDAFQNGKNLYIDKKLPSIPYDKVFYSDGKNKMSGFGAITVPTSLIPYEHNYGFECKENYTLVGIKDGQPECKCLYPFKESNGACVVDEQLCAPGERYRGTDAEGHIVCIPVFCQVMNLQKTLPNSGGTATGVDCGSGGWIEQIEISPSVANDFSKPSCVAEPCRFGKNGGGCEVDVACAGKVRCCFETTPPKVPE